MLELRPCCENCGADLPPDSLEARICSFECTFCAGCVTNLLRNVCPNCGGGFAPRPIRPATNWKGGYFLGQYPPTTARRQRPVDGVAHDAFAAAIEPLLPVHR